MKEPTQIALEFIDWLIDQDIDVRGIDDDNDKAAEADAELVELDIAGIVERSRAEGLVAGFKLARPLNGDAQSLKILEDLGISTEVYMEVAEEFAHGEAKRSMKEALEEETKGTA